MSHSTHTSWLNQFQSDDRDFRFMGTSDLLNELSTAVLKLLRDPSSEVQSLAMKCLPLLAARVSPNAASSNAAHMSVHVLTEAGGSAGKSSSSRSARSSSGGGSGDAVPGSQSLRDVAGLALKSMVATLPSGGLSAMAVVSPLASRLLAALPAEGALANSWLAAGVLESLELLADVLLRFPRQLVSFHSKARDALLPGMTLTDASVRRRAVAALAALSATASLDTLGDNARAGIAALEASPMAGVALVSALARSAGRRLVPHLRGIVPPLVSIASSSRGGDDDDDEEDFSYDVARDEQPEVALTALDSLVRQVPGPMAPYVSYVLPLALALSKHDPSYINGGAGSGEDGDDMEEDAAGSRADGVEFDEDGFREDEGDCSDDKDASWRVRRAAVWLCHALVQVDRVVAAVGGVSSRDTYVSISQTLSARFSEREEMVKLDVFDAFSGLLAVIASPLSSSSASRMVSATASTATASAPSPFSPPASAATSSDLGTANATTLSAAAPSGKSGLPVVHVPAFVGDADVEAAARTAVVEVVTARAGRTLRSLRGELHASRNGKSRAVAAAVLRRLVAVAAIVRFCGPTCLAVALSGTLAVVRDAADDRYYEVTSESLRLSEVFVGKFVPSSMRASLSAVVARIYEAAVTRLSVREPDSKVKAAAPRVLAATSSQYSTELDLKSRADAPREAVASSVRQQLDIAIPLLLPLLVETVEACGGGGATTAPAQDASAVGVDDANAEDPMAVKRAVGRASETGVRDAKNSGEECIRTATAECLGMLTTAQLQVVVPWLIDGVEGTSSTLRAVAVTAVNAPLVSRLFGETEEDKSIVRMVDLGPFRVKEDGGLELHKAALGAIVTLLHTASRSLPGKDVTDVVSHGLRDGHPDVGPLATSTLQAAVFACSSAVVLAALVSGLRDATPLLCTKFREVLFTRMEENAVRKEVQRQDEAVCGALRALRSVLPVDTLQSHPAVVTLVVRVRSSAALQARWVQACGDADAILGAAATGQDVRGGDLAMTDS
ncbi:hypothetical protein MMPV_004670 [Pyropia vietnamensis]